jgi:fucose permease
MHAAFGLGAAIGPLLMTAVLSAGLAWSVGYAGVALAQLGLATAYALVRKAFGVAPQARQAEAASALGSVLRMPLAWLLIGVFFVYVGLEVIAGQWSYSLFTQSRGLPPALAGVLVSAYWASLTGGRVLFGALVNPLNVDTLLRGCMLALVVAAALLWLNLPLLSPLALAVTGLAAAPIFPSLIAQTPARLGAAHTANAVGLQVAAAVLGGALLPGGVGALAARLGLEVVGPCLLGAACVLLVLHEALLRRAFEPPRSARSRTDAAASSRPGA